MHLLFAFLIGLLLIGSNKLRTIQILEGRRKNAVLLTCLISSCGWFGFGFVVQSDVEGYVAFAVGEMCAIWWISGKKRI